MECTVSCYFERFKILQFTTNLVLLKTYLKGNILLVLNRL